MGSSHDAGLLAVQSRPAGTGRTPASRARQQSLYGNGAGRGGGAAPGEQPGDRAGPAHVKKSIRTRRKRSRHGQAQQTAPLPVPLLRKTMAFNGGERTLQRIHDDIREAGKEMANGK